MGDNITVIDNPTRVTVIDRPVRITVRSGGAVASIAAALGGHTGDTADAHDASAISFIPTGSIAATNVQDAISELLSEIGGPYMTLGTDQTLPASKYLTYTGDGPGFNVAMVGLENGYGALSGKAFSIDDYGVLGEGQVAGAHGVGGTSWGSGGIGVLGVALDAGGTAVKGLGLSGGPGVLGQSLSSIGVPIIAKGAAGQTAPLQRWVTVADVEVASVSPAGSGTFSSKVRVQDPDFPLLTVGEFVADDLYGEVNLVTDSYNGIFNIWTSRTGFANSSGMLVLQQNEYLDLRVKVGHTTKLTTTSGLEIQPTAAGVTPLFIRAEVGQIPALTVWRDATDVELASVSAVGGGSFASLSVAGAGTVFGFLDIGGGAQVTKTQAFASALLVTNYDTSGFGAQINGHLGGLNAVALGTTGVPLRATGAIGATGNLFEAKVDTAVRSRILSSGYYQIQGATKTATFSGNDTDLRLAHSGTGDHIIGSGSSNITTLPQPQVRAGTAGIGGGFNIHFGVAGSQAGYVTLAAKMASGQTADGFRLYNNADSPLLQFTSAGQIINSVPTTDLTVADLKGNFDTSALKKTAFILRNQLNPYQQDLNIGFGSDGAKGVWIQGGSSNTTLDLLTSAGVLAHRFRMWTADTSIIHRAASGQTTDMEQWQDAGSVVQSKIDKDGRAFFKNWVVGTSAPASPAVGDVWVDTN